MKVEVVFYMDGRNRVPVLEWLDRLDQKAQDKCTAKIERLAEFGNELRRPDADLLQDKIYELRIASDRNEYRILYFFHKRSAVILCHAFLKKTRTVPTRELQRALNRKRQFAEDPDSFSFWS